MLTPGQLLSLTIDKPAAGGRMIARADGQVVLVGGTIPGERVTARVERVRKGVAYAETVSPDHPSPDRRPASGDPRCGGCAYAHIAYARQLELKALVVGDAFARIARLTPPSPVRVAASSEDGYRMRARLHARAGRVGFFLEGTHELCDARTTRQLLPQTCDVVDRVSAALRSLGLDDVQGVELSENVVASERVVQLDSASPVDAGVLEQLLAIEGITDGPYVTDTLPVNEGRSVSLRRHVRAFFQGNRYLLHALVSHVVDQVPHGGTVIDLYAGTGLFSVTAAVARSARVTAVEGDRFAAADLQANAAASGGAVTALRESVEAFMAAGHRRPDAIVLDPPRTGVSPGVLKGVIALASPALIYVSCDPATLARDARRLVDGGYALIRIDGFDLFPNTPHVETVAVFAHS